MEHEDDPCQFQTITEVRTFPRNHFTLPVRLVEAATGRELARADLQNGPEACTSGVFVSDDNDEDESEGLSVDQLGTWLDLQLVGGGPVAPVPAG